MEVLASQFKNADPVLAGGNGRLVLEPKSGISVSLAKGSRHIGVQAGFCQSGSAETFAYDMSG